ncbi:CHAD domain-containing protein [Rhodopila sp.]|uniref:CYTH and CHAD domain-containing protein n=1 Tax=Rhodopila sp. TaxID=2480087 RepID=UPI003D10FC47
MTHHQSRRSLGRSLAEAIRNKPAREVELKFTIPEKAVNAIGHKLGSRMAEGGPRHRHEVTTYFDTDDQALSRIGISLRVRCSDGGYVQTLKANRKYGVAANRAEWEWPVDENKPDLNLVAQTPLAEKLPSGLDLVPVVSTDIDRSVRVLELDDGTRVEAALDEGTIAAGEARRPVHELELELRQGDPGPLFRWALELHAAVALTIESESKAERGYPLRNDAKPAVQKAKDVALEPAVSAAVAFRDIVTAALGHLLANQPAALSGDAEGVHQMRVAIRRLRAALTLFEPHLEPHTASRFQTELRRIGRVFGQARDWDVFSLQVLPDALDAAGAARWHELLRAPAMAEQAAAHWRFAEEVRAPGFTALALGLAAWVEEGFTQRGLLGDAALNRPIEDLAPILLDRLMRKVRRRGRHIGRHSDAERHALRKSVKKLRYGIDYLRCVYRNESVDRYLHACKKLQKTLGDLNDAVTATALADGLGRGNRPDLVPALGALGKQLDQQRQDGRRKLAKRWRMFRNRRKFWK